MNDAGRIRLIRHGVTNQGTPTAATRMRHLGLLDEGHGGLTVMSGVVAALQQQSESQHPASESGGCDLIGHC